MESSVIRTKEADHFLKRLILAMMILSATCSAYAQGTFVYDQQSATNGRATGGSRIQNQQPMGQSFTPQSSLVGFVQFQFGNFSGSVGSTVYVSLMENSITGNVLAVSAPIFMANNFLGTTNFFFPSNVPVQPGSEYYFRPVLQSGDNLSVLSDLYNYPGGTAFFNGAPTTDPGLDFWFREGYIVPEPSVACLSLAGVAVAVWFRRRKSRQRTSRE